MRRKIGLVFVLMVILTCCGCSDEVKQTLSMAKNVAETAIQSQIEAKEPERSYCKTQLSYVQGFLNERNSFILPQFLSRRIVYDKETRDLCQQLSNDQFNNQLRGLAFEKLCQSFIDDKLNINFRTISDLKFEIKDMYDYGEYIKGYAVMTNGGEQQNVIVTWYPEWARNDGVWLVYSITADE